MIVNPSPTFSPDHSVFMQQGGFDDDYDHDHEYDDIPCITFTMIMMRADMIVMMMFAKVFQKELIVMI